MEIIKLILLIVFSVLPYIFSLDGEFVFDDSEAIVKNVDLISNQSYALVLSHDFWGTDMKSNTSHKSYRPVTIFTFRLNKYLDNDILISKHFKITNLLLHTLVTLCVYFLLHTIQARCKNGTIFIRNIWKDESFISSLIFAVHPIHVEAVSGIVGRADILAALFLIIAILIYNKIINMINANVLQLFIYFTLFLMANVLSVLSKEIGITALIICSIYDTILECGDDLINIIKNNYLLNIKNTTKAIVKLIKTKQFWLFRQSIILMCLIFLLYMRMAIMDFKSPQFHDVDNPTAFSESFVQRVLTYNYIYFINVLILIWPEWLCFDWSMGCIPILEGFSDKRTIFVILFWSTTTLLLLKVTKNNIFYINKRQIIILITLIAIPFLPASNIIMPVGFVIAERILYIPSIGFCALVAKGFCKIQTQHNNFKAIFRMIFFIYISIFIMRTIERSNEWRNENLLYNSALNVCPLNAKVHYNIGKNAADNNNLGVAENEYEKAIRLYPRYYQAMNNLANLLKDQSRFIEAEQLLKTALEIKQDFSAAWMNLGIVLANLNKPLEAQDAYIEALKYRKKYADCYYNMGNLYLEQNKHDLALNAWSEATNINPYHAVAWSNTLALLYNTGKIKRALELVPIALSLLPQVPAIHFNIANLMGKNNEFVIAEKHFLEAIKLKKETVPSIYYTNLGVLYHRWKKRELAIDSYTKALEIDPQSKSAMKNLQSLTNY